MQANLGRIPFELTMTTRYSHAEAVFLRLKANCVSSFIKSSSRSQSKNAIVFNRGEEGGFENKVENRCDRVTSHSITSVSRAGRDDGENIMSLVCDLVGRRTRRNVRTSVIQGGGSLGKGFSKPRATNDKLPFGPNSRMVLRSG